MAIDIAAVFTIIGVTWVLWLLTDMLWELILGMRVFIMPNYFKQSTTDLISKFGSWAVITGSTDGIGKAYANELAKRGINIVFISRNMEKLLQVSSEIELKHRIKTKVIAADFSEGKPALDKVENELKNTPVGILVNNVGKNYVYPSYLTEVSQNVIWDILNINIAAATMMTRMILPQMIQRRKGAIVNLSSGSDLQPLPLMTVYAASKAFVKSFTEALRYEYQKYGITIQTLSPYFVNTKMNAFSDKLQKTNIFTPDAKMYAESAVNTLGYVDHSTGYWIFGIQYFIISLIPVSLRTYVGGMMNQLFRKEYLTSQRKKNAE